MDELSAELFDLIPEAMDLYNPGGWADEQQHLQREAAGGGSGSSSEKSRGEVEDEAIESGSVDVDLYEPYAANSGGWEPEVSVY